MKTRKFGSPVLMRFLMLFFCVIFALLTSGCEDMLAELSADKTQWYVSTTGSDKNLCHTAKYPCRNIATALSRAAPKDTIHIADGEYYEMLSVTKDITIKGSSMEHTIIDAQLNGGSVIKAEGQELLLIITDLTLTGGATGNGGGLFVQNSAYTALKNVKIDKNYANGDGGGIYFNVATWAQLDGVVITGNHTGKDGSGGGIFFSIGDSGSPVAYEFKLDITNSNISNNAAGKGGGVYNKATLNLTKSTLEGNTAVGEGGGVDNQYHASITQSILRNNKAMVGGGAYSSSYGVLSVAESTIDNNQATDGCGGGIDLGGSGGKGGLSFISSTISGNQASSGGGVCSGRPIYAINSTFSGNSGGGIYTYNHESTLEGINLTIADNIGGGLIISGPTGTMEVMEKSTLTNVLMSYNQGGNCLLGSFYTGDDAPITSVTNLSSDDTCPGFIENGPGIAALADNGGLTWTHALLPGSPARDTGTEYPGLYTDQRQFTRPLDSDGDGVAKTDIGAFEAEYQTFTPIIIETPAPVRGGPFFIPDSDPYCRQGPSFLYLAIGAAVSGQEYPLTGQSVGADWYLLQFTDTLRCWVRKDTGHTIGDISMLETVLVDIITPTRVPTITPTAAAGPNCRQYNIEECKYIHNDVCRWVGEDATGYCERKP